LGQETELGSFMAVCANWFSMDTTGHMLWAKAAPVGDVLRKFPDFQALWDDFAADAVSALVGAWVLARLWRARRLCHADSSTAIPFTHTFWTPAFAGLAAVMGFTSIVGSRISEQLRMPDPQPGFQVLLQVCDGFADGLHLRAAGIEGTVMKSGCTLPAKFVEQAQAILRVTDRLVERLRRQKQLRQRHLTDDQQANVAT